MKDPIILYMLIRTHESLSQPMILDYSRSSSSLFYSMLLTPSVLYLASKQTSVLWTYCVVLFLTGISNHTCKGPLINL